MSTFDPPDLDSRSGLRHSILQVPNSLTTLRFCKDCEYLSYLVVRTGKETHFEKPNNDKIMR